ncbi:MAG TPA: hypothetical protein VKR31_08215 [Rhizomicrobium sp.]|nr:hypothetical protein [Rhizomicrobium sp.]
MIRSKGRAILLASACGSLLAMGHAAGAATFTTFLVNGAAEMFPAAIDATNDVAGTWYDSGYVTHGFVRTSNGTLTSFDPTGSTGTNVHGMNNNQVIVGSFSDAGGTHGFIRAADGTITVYDAPGSAGYTVITGIDDSGAFAGSYSASGNDYGFIVNAKGKFKSFGVTGQRYTEVTALSAKGVTTGYENGDNGLHLFVRASDGTITTFDVPHGNNPDADGVNKRGAVAGTSYKNYNSNSGRGFLRLSNGKTKTFQVVPGYETDGYALNDQNMVCGNYYDSSGAYHGYIRAGTTTTTIDAPDSVGATGCTAINDSGVVAGYFFDSSDVGNAYLRTP